jgi:hypothetical protein
MIIGRAATGLDARPRSATAGSSDGHRCNIASSISRTEGVRPWSGGPLRRADGVVRLMAATTSPALRADQRLAELGAIKQRQ